MNRENGGAPADGGNEPIQDVQDTGAQDAGAGEGQGERTPLTAEQYEERDRQKTAALREERARARTYSRELEEMKRDIAALRQNGSGSQARQMADQLEDIPDPEEDPMEALKALRKIASRFTTEQRQTTETTETNHRKRQVRERGDLGMKTEVREHQGLCCPPSPAWKKENSRL